MTALIGLKILSLCRLLFGNIMNRFVRKLGSLDETNLKK